MASTPPPPPATMRAFRHISYAEDPTAAVAPARDAPTPTLVNAKPGSLLIHVSSSALNIGDAHLARGVARALFSLPLPVVVGRDFAGAVIAANGSDYKPGDVVAGFVPVGAGGTFGEYLVTVASNVARVPPGVPLPLAAALPTAAVTTYQALVGRGLLPLPAAGASATTGRPPTVQRVLVLGGSSATGQVAIQLAALHGATTIATTSSQAALVTRLGATRVVDHRAGADWAVELAGQKFDLIYDCAEGLPAWGKARPFLTGVPRADGTTGTGVFVSLVMDDPHAHASLGGMLTFVGRVAYRAVAAALFGAPRFVWHINMGSAAELPALLALAAAGRLTPTLDGPPRPPTDAAFAEMFARQASGRAAGKLVMDWTLLPAGDDAAPAAAAAAPAPAAQ